MQVKNFNKNGKEIDLEKVEVPEELKDEIFKVLIAAKEKQRKEEMK